ncbi:hydantoinase/oxoprolinase family protein [uncultured Roseovarius sp.]|uniref:hydantoinase/oxoprolinase family protein n=1 Tax=uncultured Roseovarius sp. TaxID=293344 RepID=UPI000C4755EA|nr:hydantoinase [Roseovarius sp.]MBD11282.1 hydantoinase [Roseovarius sp.]
MALLLGVDTGGTYTDAVLIRDEREVIASAKALTTRHDLAIGIGEAVETVLRESGADVAEIGLASLSTTLATNALVEGQGGRAGLVYIGFRAADLQTHGLAEALGGDPALVLTGGHNHAGGEAQPLDKDALLAWLETGTGAEAYAVASLFATRNPAHELAAAEMIRAATGRPVSLSHHLSAKLNGPKRALTALLNARLIGMIARLIDRAEGKLGELGIHAPLMVVRGDGALISADQARERPIETILSGPAASIVGARWLTGAEHALVSDIGGTTTDVAVLREGRPAIDPEGARVGAWRTMVEAVAMRTFGLGGDSEVHVRDEGLEGGVTLGPRRVVPVSLMAAEAGAAVRAVLEEQLRATAPGEHDARFVRAVPGIEAGGLGEREEALLGRIGDDVRPVGKVLKTRMDGAALTRLVRRGLVQVAGITPSDASHVLGGLDSWDAEAARMALELVARKRTGSGNRLAEGPEHLARMIVDRLTYQTSLALLETAFAEEEMDFGLSPATLAEHVLMQRGLDGHRGLVRIESGLAVPVIGLGASAASYYGAVGARLGCEMILPAHGGVANAIGAVVGRVTIRRGGTVTSPSEGKYRVHLESGPQDYAASDAAMTALETVLRAEAQAEAEAAGAVDIHVTARREVKEAQAEARRVFLEAEIVVEASGRPRIAV